MTDEDIYAFRPVPGTTPESRPRRRVWPWALAAMVLVLLLMAAAGTSALMALSDATRDGFHVVIDGDEWRPTVLATDHWGLALLGVAAAIFAVLLIVPVAVLLALTCAGLGIGVALLAVLVAAAVALSPLWLVALLLWLLLRRKPSAHKATMSA